MKVLIADDEEYTREGIVDSVKWDSFGIDEVMQAQNGEEAEQITRWFHPDIVITDIRMPKLDGISFTERLLQASPGCKIIFISGYMEIDYYKSAIQMSAIDYIEKPIDVEVLKKALKKAVDSICETRKKDAAVKLSEIYNENRLFYSLTQRDRESLCGEAEKEKLMTQKQSAVCMICTGPSTSKAINLIKGEGFQLVVNSIDDSMAEFILVYKRNEKYRITPLVHKLINSYADVVIARGMSVDRYQDVADSYETAKVAMNKAFYKTGERYFYEEEASSLKSVIDPGVYSEFCRLLAKNPEELEDWFKGLFNSFNKDPYYSHNQVCSLITSLLIAVDSKFNVVCNSEAAIAKEQYIASLVGGFESINELKNYIFSLLEKIIESYKASEGYSRITKGALDYITKHYSEPDLSVNDIADYLHISGPYLNVLFKQEMKCTLKQYLGNYRIERAKEMLKQGYSKINEIAVACGYANGNYFAKVFRESTEMTPQEYRKDYENN